MKCFKPYLRLLPIVALIIAAIVVPMIIEDAFLREKLYTVTDAVDMLAAGVDAEPSRLWYEHERNVQDAVEHMDRIDEIYAAAFKMVNGEPVLFTERYYEFSPLEPFEYAEFVEAVETEEYGSMVIHYAPDGRSYRDIYVYFRWMPLYSPIGERYLVVMGVSKHSIVTQSYIWVSIGLWIIVIGALIPTVRSILIYCKRKEC